MDYGERLLRSWAATERGLPNGWTFDSLRCASSSLAPEDRSDRWRALAIGPDGEEAEGRGLTPESAMAELVSSLGGPPTSN
jgi:hypothetical protein